MSRAKPSHRVYRLIGPNGKKINIIGPARSYAPRSAIESMQIELSHIDTYAVTHNTGLPQPFGRSLRAALLGPKFKYAQRQRGSERDFRRDCFKKR